MAGNREQEFSNKSHDVSIKAFEMLAGLHPAMVIFGTNLIVCFSFGTKFSSS